MSSQTGSTDTLSPQIERALAECATGARIAEWKADRYLQLSQGEADDTVYEACRSMSRFYGAMHEFFMEEQRAIDALLGTCPPSDPLRPTRHA
ncbi:hypothetical protein [Methylobacterium dankookense]|uniref:Uncharacterized protein n=1 Tax=Methylobacterium dankookense TaxID=560405 RepID=A0A564FVB5_9HYPH|nr:hypothetical protein [Methylobacterium dankookense]GJD57140.1 hypothetical protein IFDJLNFL_3040 [Methylobacterium dankookense]VUF11686.1 hypothetical protein MTDSW087_01370 [Methylobacterium dankookense]